MSPTRRDILKAMTATVAAAAVPATDPIPSTALAASTPGGPCDIADAVETAWTVEELVDAHVPEHLHCIVVARDPSASGSVYGEVDFFCSDEDGFITIRISSYRDDVEPVVIRSMFTPDRRLMVALAAMGGTQ